jgi:hypothetical protein
VREKLETAIGAGEVRLVPLLRFPQLVAAPIVLATVWNGLWGGEQPVDTEAMYQAFLDLAFGPAEDASPATPTRSRDAGT